MNDYTDSYIGNIHVLERDYNYGKDRNLVEWKKKTYWKCQCLLCGNIFIQQGSVIKRRGENNKCPSCSKSCVEIGKKYGHLLIIERDDDYVLKRNIKKHILRYKCLCDCGKITTKPSTYLKGNKDANCGCLSVISKRKLARSRMKDITGEKFGLLTVIGLDEKKSKPGQIFWNCSCECGNNISVCIKHLKRGATISCGCIKRSLGETIIENILLENKINFKSEYVVKELDYKRFDFAIFNNENKVIRLIEFDGRQHYVAVGLFGGEEEFKKRKNSDLEKNIWANENNIPIVRIPYWEIGSITYDMIFNDDNFLVNSKTFNDHSLQYE